VKVAVLSERGSIALLNVAEILALMGTPVSLREGLVALTMGGVVSAAVPVVKVHVCSDAKALPAGLLALAVIFPVKTVLAARLFVGVKIAVVPSAPAATVPETGLLPWFTTKAVGVSESGSIASLKTTETLVLRATPLAPSSGLDELTMGALSLSSEPPHAARGEVTRRAEMEKNKAIRKALLR
jgi:hypothetical protein